MTQRTWRADWDRLMRGEGCPFCANRGIAENEHGIRVFEGAFADVYLQKRAPLRGYAIAIWKRDHVAEPTDLAARDRDGYFADVFAAGAALRHLTNAAKMNYEVLGNTVPHLHTHIFCRFVDDPAPGRPLPIELLLEPPALDDAQLRRDAAAVQAALTT